MVEVHYGIHNPFNIFPLFDLIISNDKIIIDILGQTLYKLDDTLKTVLRYRKTR